MREARGFERPVIGAGMTYALLFGAATIAAAAITLSGCAGDEKESRAPRQPAAYQVQANSIRLGASLVEQESREQYDAIDEEGFVSVERHPLSTFSIDVDTASYANVRRLLREGTLPTAGAVRIEEFINAFTYDDPGPKGDVPFAVSAEVSQAPWQPEHQLVRIAVRGQEIAEEDLPPRNLTFLLDVSGSMSSRDKLPLVRRAMSALVRNLGPEDHVALVVYAGASGLVLPPTRATDREKILDALGRLQAGGATAGAEGIALAYSVAREHFDPDGINRVILATDGDFNVGPSSRSELVELIEREREGGVMLTVLGVGTGNLQDATMEELSNRGNGNYAYLDDYAEARRVLVEQAGGTLVTIAQDVKIQVEWNPAHASAYRLIGYENRRLADEDFNDDSKDAGELGAGHVVTALYEVVPPGSEGAAPPVDALRYQTPRSPSSSAFGDELMTVKLRYKDPGAERSQRIEQPVAAGAVAPEQASDDLRFAASVAAFGLTLRRSPYRGEASYDQAIELASGAFGQDPRGERRAFVQLVQLAKSLDDRPAPEHLSRGH